MRKLRGSMNGRSADSNWKFPLQQVEKAEKRIKEFLEIIRRWQQETILIRQTEG